MVSPKPDLIGRLLLLPLLLTVVGLQSATAQESPELSLAAVAPYSAEFDFFLEGESGELVQAGTWSDQVSVDSGQLTRTVKRYTNDGVVDLLRTVIVDQQTVAPVRIQQRFGPGLANVYQVDFSEQTLTQILIGDASRPARVSSTELDKPVVETGLQAVFALSLPMESHSDVTVTSYVAGAEPKTAPKTYHIVGQETVEVMGRALEAWRIEDRAAQWTYWVRRDAPYIAKVVHPVPGGKMATSLVTSFSPLQN